MIKRKKKVCKRCRKPKFLFSSGLCPECYRKWNPPKPKPRAKIKPKKAYKIPRVSKKLKILQNEYSKIRAEYLRENPCCEVGLPGCSGCDKRLLQLHHKAGRVGKMLTNSKFFLTACFTCHRFIEDNPEIACENGWSTSRLQKES